MTRPPDIVCIGSVHWDVIGRAPGHVRVGADLPGRIARQPGGVAMNVATTLRRFAMTPALLTAMGRDDEGADLLARCRRLGLITDHVHLCDDLPTDRYMAVEGANGLIAAIADARSLEAAGDKILAALHDGRLGRADAPYPGRIALDGNLTVDLLAAIATSPLFAAADLRVAAASTGKAERLRPFLATPNATIYVNLEEAGLLHGARFDDAAAAASALRARGPARFLVTDGANPVAMAGPDGVATATPPAVAVTRVTGAGDTFMAAHIAAEARGEAGQSALATALRAAADHIAGDVVT